jgi:membrane dipeptidase
MTILRNINIAVGQLLRYAGILVLAFLASGVASPQGNDGALSAHARSLHKKAIVIDTHVDTTQRLIVKGFNLSSRHAEGHLDLPRMREGGLGAVFFAIWTTGTRPAPEALKSALAQLDAVRETIRANPKDLVFATTADEVRRAHKNGEIAILLDLEGGHMIAEDLGVLRIFASLGIRCFTLTHMVSTNWAGSSGDTNASRGLSDFGRQVIAEANHLGVMVDVSHVSDRTFDDVLAVSQAPVIASHSSMRTIAGHPRNLTDDMLRRLAAK